MSLLLECESTGSIETSNQRRDYDFFTVSFDGAKGQQTQIHRRSRSRKLAELSEPRLIETLQKCPVGQYYDEDVEACASCFPANAQIDSTKPFNLLEWTAPSRACPDEGQGYNFTCIIKDMNMVNLWPDFDSGCNFEAGSLNPGSMYDVEVLIEKKGVDISAESVSIVTVAEDFTEPICSLGEDDSIVLHRGEESEAQVQIFGADDGYEYEWSCHVPGESRLKGAYCPFKTLGASSDDASLVLDDDAFGPEGAKFDLVFSMQKQNSNIVSQCYTIVFKSFSEQRQQAIRVSVNSESADFATDRSHLFTCD